MICEFKYKQGQGDKECISEMIDTLMKDKYTGNIVVFEYGAGAFTMVPEDDTYTSFFKQDKENNWKWSKKEEVTIIDTLEYFENISKITNLEEIKEYTEKYFEAIFDKCGVFYICHQGKADIVLENLKKAYAKKAPNSFIKNHLVIVDCLNRYKSDFNYIV